MTSATQRRRSLVPYDPVEDRATLGAAVFLTVLVMAGVVFWGVLRNVVLPTRNTIRFVALVLVGGTATASLLYRPPRRPWYRNAAFALALVASIVGVGLLPTHIEVEVRTHEAQLIAVATQRLQADPTGTSACQPAPPGLDAGDLGPIDTVCVIGFRDNFAVEFNHAADATHTDGVVYTPHGRVNPTASCFRHLYGPWIAFLYPADPNCPYGFDYTGAG